MKKILLLGVLLYPECAHADSPLPPPSIAIVRSRSGRFFAQTNPKTNSTTIYRAASERQEQKRLWKMKGWFRVLFLADDGQHLVSAYNGVNLLALEDARPQTIMLRFFRAGKPLRTVTLGELGLGKKNLRRTVSHFAWGMAEGFDASGLFHLSTIDERRLLFDPRTGRKVKALRERWPTQVLQRP